jgi:hypothetical protein
MKSSVDSKRQRLNKKSRLVTELQKGKNESVSEEYTMRGYCVTALHNTHIHIRGIEIGRNGVGDDSVHNLK